MEIYTASKKIFVKRLYPIKKCNSWQFPGGAGVKIPHFTTKGPGLISGLGAEILQTTWCNQM